MILFGRSIGGHEEDFQFDGAFRLDHRPCRAAHGRDPLGDFVGVGHRRRETHELNVVRKVDDDFLPDRTSVGVLDEVDLVEHDRSEGVETTRTRIDHVSQNLGRHHHHGRVAVDGVVAREQTYPVTAVQSHQVVVLLVREGLDGRGVERSPPLGQGTVDSVFGDHRLATSGGCGDHHRGAGIDRIHGVELETVERKPVPLDERGANRVHERRRTTR